MAESIAAKPRRARRRRLTAAQQRLAERYLALARSLARPMKTTWPNAADELESAACLALVQSARAFDARRGVKFATFARTRILGALLDVHRRMAIHHRREHQGVELNRQLHEHGCEGTERIFGRSPEPPVGDRLEQSELFECWLRRVPTQHATACRLIYLNGMNQCEAAREMGCSQSRLSALHREALAMLNGTWDRSHAESSSPRAAALRN